MSVFNKDELTPPEWLNENVVAEILREYEQGQDIELTKCEFSPASMKGDHYASIIFRINTNYKLNKTCNKSKRLILKTLPDDGSQKQKNMRESQIFETEIEMYTKALPAIENLLTKNGDHTKFGPRLIYHTLKPHKIVVLEDLCELGYSIMRNRYPTEHESAEIYKKMAKLHAVTFAIGKSDDRDLVTSFQNGIFSTSILLSMPIMQNGIQNFIDTLSEYEDLLPYKPKFETLKHNLLRECQKVFCAYADPDNTKVDDIFVLNHGDLHLKNMMFKFNEQQEFEDVVMLDLQMSVFAPSNIDINYATYMVLSPELRLKQNEFLQIYFKQFQETLKLIGYQGEMPNIERIEKTNVKYRHFTLFLLTTFLPFTSSLLKRTPEQLKDVDDSDVVEKANSFKELYHDPTYLEEMKNLLPRLLNDGYLD